MENNGEYCNRQFSYLSFSLGETYFAMDVVHTESIIELPEITRVPQMPSYMLGIINLRGKAIPIIDTKQIVGMGISEIKSNTSLIIVAIENEHEKIVVGLLVDAVLDVIEINDEKILPPPGIGSRNLTNFIEGMFYYQKNYLLILNVGLLLNMNDAGIIQDHKMEEFV